MNFDKETFRTMPGVDGAVASFGAAPANAVTLKIVHDERRDRVYTGVLTVPMESPRDKAAENAAMAAKFLRVFAPSCDKPEAVISASVGQINGKGPGERFVKLGEDYKLTVWNSGPGEVAFKVESPRADMGE